MRLRNLFGVLLILLVAGCGGSGEDAATPPETESAPAEPPPAEPEPTEEVSDQAQAGAEEPAESEPTPEPEPTPPPAAKRDERSTAPAGPHPGLRDPSQATETAPETFRVKFETTEGDFVVEVHRDWSPLGADRFYNLVKIGYFEDVAFFRVIPGFMAQFGMSGDPAIYRAWEDATILDEPVKQSNQRGYITFAKTGRPNSRSVQFFINFGDNRRLDAQGFSPFGRVVEGMDVVDSLYSGYGEGAPRGRGPSQGLIARHGNEYLREQFPELDYIENATIM